MGSDQLNEEAVCQGTFSEALKLSKKALKVFISSTFTDTKAERNYLMREIYPRIRQFCDERGIDFSVVDYRWGIRDHDTNDHTTKEICMNEIDKCYHDSIDAPCFVFLSFNRYGWTPLPRTIASQEFQIILDGIKDAANKRLVTKWYVEDCNSVPPVYTLQPISSEIPEITNDTGC